MAEDVNRLTRAQVREIDRGALETYHIPGIVLMENAARASADVAWELLTQAADRNVLILCGGGNNGGDGLAIARHLHNRGAGVTIGCTIDPAKYSGDALINWEITQAMKLPTVAITADYIGAANASLIVDAIFGTGLRQAPRPPFGEMVAAVEKLGVPVMAVDLPSGLDCDTGEPLGACIRAAVTVTFVAEKAGFSNPVAKRFTGEVRIGEIGCPVELIEAVRG